jgi:hypothetical protein
VPENTRKENQIELILNFLETNEKIIRKDVGELLSVGDRLT